MDFDVMIARAEKWVDKIIENNPQLLDLLEENNVPVHGEGGGQLDINSGQEVRRPAPVSPLDGVE